EMVVPGLSRRKPAAHGERLKQLGVEIRVCQSAAVEGLVRSAVVGEKSGSGGIHTEPILDRPANKTLCVNRSGEMIVKVSALGHALQKIQQKRRLVANGVKISRGSSLGSRCASVTVCVRLRFLRPRGG